TQNEAVVRRGDSTIANDWHPASPARNGYWMERGAYIRGAGDSERRRKRLENAEPGNPFEWVRAPVLNGFTRLAVEASAASGELRVLGYEPARRFSGRVSPATAILDVIVGQYGIRPAAAHTDVHQCPNPGLGSLDTADRGACAVAETPIPA